MAKLRKIADLRNRNPNSAITLDTKRKSTGEQSVNKRCSVGLRRGGSTGEAIKSAGKRNSIRSYVLHRPKHPLRAVAGEAAADRPQRRSAQPATEELVLDLAGLAHDLRAPLAAIEQVVQLIVAEHLGRLSAEQREALRGVLRRCVDLENLIGNVLDLARSELGRLQPVLRPVSVHEVLECSMERLQFLRDHKALQIQLVDVDRLPPVFADRDMLERVLTNLLSNAMKASPEGGTLKIGGSLASLTHVLLEIHDQGPGMDPEQLRQVLRPFVSGEAQNASSGVGLGLAIVRRLLKAQYATMTIRTARGQGTTIGVVLLRFAPAALVRRFLARDAALLAECVVAEREALELVARLLAEETAGAAIVIPDEARQTITLLGTSESAQTRFTAALRRLEDIVRWPITVQWLGRAASRQRVPRGADVAGQPLPAREADLSQAG